MNLEEEVRILRKENAKLKRRVAEMK